MRLIFVRHGEAEGNVGRRFHGQYDSELTENGRRQAERTAQALKNEPIDAIYASDLRRTMMTARYIADAKGLPIIADSALREIDGGEWEDTPWDELPVKYPESYEHWLNFPHLLQMPGGESMADFQARVSGAVGRIAEAETRENICIVTHGTAIKALVCLWKGVGLDKFPDLPWYDNASITIAQYRDGRYTLLLEGDNTHLGELSTLAKQDWWKKLRGEP